MLRSHEFQILDRTQIGFLFYLNFSKDLYSTAHCGDIILYLKKKFFDWRPLKPSFISIQNAASDSYEIILISNAIFLSVNILSFSTTVRYSFAISLRQRSFKAPTTTVVMKIGKYCGPLGMRHFLGAEIFRHHHSLSPS